MNTEMFVELRAGSAALIQALDAWHAGNETAHYKQRSYELVPLGARRLLDVGCGTGDDVLALAERLGPNTSLIGLDRRLELVDEAQRRARNVALDVRFAVGDAHSLPFGDESFDVVRADCVLHRAPDRARILRELVRVLAPGGCLLLHDHEGVLGGARDELGGSRDELRLLLCGTGIQSIELFDSWRWEPQVRANERGLSLRGVRSLAPQPRVEHGQA